MYTLLFVLMTVIGLWVELPELLIGVFSLITTVSACMELYEYMTIRKDSNKEIG